jgi:mono/diheme cytochrome c family protein
MKRCTRRHPIPAFVLFAVLGVTAFSAVGCSRGSEPAPAAKGTASVPSAPPAAPAGADAAKEEAKQIFASRCATCHGVTGAGNGPASAGLDPKPRNFHDPTWQASVTDEHIEKILQYGGAAVGKSAAMPSNPDLTSKPEVVAALRAYVRSLKE